MKIKLENKKGHNPRLEFNGEEIKHVTKAVVKRDTEDITLEVGFTQKEISYEADAQVIAIIDGRRYKLCE